MTQSLPLINEVINSDLCIACGACIPACQYSNIRPDFNSSRGAPEVKIIDTEQCIGCERPCDSVCPSIQVDFLKNKGVLHQSESSEEHPNRDEWIRSVHLGWSPKYKNDNVSSSGGVLRAFIAHALSENTPVICLAHDPKDSKLKPRLLTNVKEMECIPGSIYHSTSFVGAIDLIRHAHSPVLLVAIPCQLSGILRYIACYEQELSGQIKLVCGIVCGWMYSYHSLKAFSKFNNISVPIYEATTYRGSDRVGKIVISTQSRRYLFERRNFKNIKNAADYLSCFSTDFNRLRCRVCEDHLNLNADLIAGDAWLKRVTSEKISIIGCRTQRGELALSTLEQLGLIKLESSSFEDILESQSPNLVLGHNARKMSCVLKEKGLLMPSFLFKDSDAIVEINIKDKYAVNMEMARRHLARSGYYSLYKLLYVARRMRLFLGFFFREIKGWISRP